MRLSDMTTRQAADALCRLVPYFGALASDEELMGALVGAAQAEKPLNRLERAMRGANRLVRITPILLQKHRNVLSGILGVLEEKTAEEIEAQNLLVTLGQLRELLHDRELIDFFGSCAGTVKSGYSGL